MRLMRNKPPGHVMGYRRGAWAFAGLVVASLVVLAAAAPAMASLKQAVELCTV